MDTITPRRYDPREFKALTFHDATSRFRDGSDTPRAYLERCLETIAARDPDWIVVLRESDDTAAPAYATRLEWQVIRAAREHRFLILPAELFGQPSARAPEAVTRLRRRLSP